MSKKPGLLMPGVFLEPLLTFLPEASECQPLLVTHELDAIWGQIDLEREAFSQEHPQLTNGQLLGNPKFNWDGRNFRVEAQVLRYLTYFGAHRVRQKLPLFLGEQLCALSVCGLVYDRLTRQFYLNVRPADSQEDPGKADAPGGVLNPESEQYANPQLTVHNRLCRKLGLELDPEEVRCVGVTRLFDEHYSLYNLNYLAVVDARQPTVDNWVAIGFNDDPDEFQLTTPARAMLQLAKYALS